MGLEDLDRQSKALEQVQLRAREASEGPLRAAVAQLRQDLAELQEALVASGARPEMGQVRGGAFAEAWPLDPWIAISGQDLYLAHRSYGSRSLSWAERRSLGLRKKDPFLEVGDPVSRSLAPSDHTDQFSDKAFHSWRTGDLTLDWGTGWDNRERVHARRYLAAKFTELRDNGHL